MKTPKWTEGCVQIFTGMLTPEQCDEIRTAGMKLPQQPGTGALHNNINGERYFNVLIRAVKVRFFEDGPVYEFVKDMFEKINADPQWRYVIDSMDPVQFARYEQHDFFEWHTDVRRIAPVRKVSLVIQLDDPANYEGGRFQFNPNEGELWEPEAFVPQGSVIVFTPNMVHRVTPVKAGVRHSVTAWFKGPPLR